MSQITAPIPPQQSHFLKILPILLFSLLQLFLLFNPLNLDSPTFPGHQNFMFSSHQLAAKCSGYLQTPLQGCETGWDLGPGTPAFAAVLAPGQTSPQATKYKETIRD